MIFVTGPLYSGKLDYVRSLTGWEGETLAARVVYHAQDLAAACETPEELEALANRLAAYPVVIATEVGGGVVPVDPSERAARERAGRLSCLLARRAERVVRVFCGIPIPLKGGDGPC